MHWNCKVWGKIYSYLFLIGSLQKVSIPGALWFLITHTSASHSGLDVYMRHSIFRSDFNYAADLDKLSIGKSLHYILFSSSSFFFMKKNYFCEFLWQIITTKCGFPASILINKYPSKWEALPHQSPQWYALYSAYK